MAQPDQQHVFPSFVLAGALLFICALLLLSPASMVVRLGGVAVALAAAFWGWSQLQKALQQARQQAQAQQQNIVDLQAQQDDVQLQQQQFLQAVLPVWRDQQQVAHVG